jgi:hypothetical protein
LIASVLFAAAADGVSAAAPKATAPIQRADAKTIAFVMMNLIGWFLKRLRCASPPCERMRRSRLFFY